MAWYYKKMPVILGLLVLGPFGFPLLWKSPQFTLLWKIILTAATILLTVWLVIITLQASGPVIQMARRLAEAEQI